MITVPCGNCMPCRVNHAQDWRFRMQQEMKCCISAHFLTLTYADEHIPRNDLGWTVLHKPDLQKFIKRVRWESAKLNKAQGEQYYPPIRYLAVGEYGEESLRAHYHMIIFNVPKQVILNLRNTWKFGHIYEGTVTPASINYVTKYITKVDSRILDKYELPRPFQTSSKGMGLSYVSDESIEYHGRFASMLTVKKHFHTRLPGYYHKYIHDPNDQQRQEKLKLYKQRRKMNAIKRDEDRICAIAKQNLTWKEHIAADKLHRDNINKSLSYKKKSKL